MRLVPSPIRAATCDGGSVAAAVTALDGVLGALHTGLKNLIEIADRKLAAMRSADAESLHACAARETDLLQAHFATERERDAVLALLAQHLPALSARPLHLGAVADAIPEPGASRIRARMQGLRTLAGELQKKNALAADVARRLQSHIREVFAAVAEVNQECVVYGRNGQHEAATTRRWVDAVG